jgi:hypothetical protein
MADDRTTPFARPDPGDPPPDGLTPAQLAAIDLLWRGAGDAETARRVNVHRVTVTRWRLYHPEFRAALADRREQFWGQSAARLRELLPEIFDALAAALKREDTRVGVALALLKFVGGSVLDRADAARTPPPGPPPPSSELAFVAGPSPPPDAGRPSEADVRAALATFAARAGRTSAVAAGSDAGPAGLAAPGPGPAPENFGPGAS